MVTEKTKNKTAKTQNEFQHLEVIHFPLSTEKTVRLMEAENKLLFEVERTATKAQIKNAVEKMFKAKVAKVNVFITPQFTKRAYVKFAPETHAIDIATDLGLL